jgi:hypothetical protein
MASLPVDCKRESHRFVQTSEEVMFTRGPYVVPSKIFEHSYFILKWSENSVFLVVNS